MPRSVSTACAIRSERARARDYWCVRVSACRKKVLGEAMLKSQQEKANPGSTSMDIDNDLSDPDKYGGDDFNPDNY